MKFKGRGKVTLNLLKSADVSEVNKLFFFGEVGEGISQFKSTRKTKITMPRPTFQSLQIFKIFLIFLRNTEMKAIKC